MIGEWYKWEEDFNKVRTALKLEIKKFNKENQLCYYDSIDLTGKGLDEETAEEIEGIRFGVSKGTEITPI